MRRFSTLVGTSALLAASLPAGSAQAADPYPAKLMVCVANPNEGAIRMYTFKVFPNTPGAGTLAQVRAGSNGEKGCLAAPLGFRGGSYTIEFFNLDRFDGSKNVTNSRITKLVVKNKGAKAKIIKPAKEQGPSLKTVITLPPTQTTKLTYTITVLKPTFPRGR